MPSCPFWPSQRSQKVQEDKQWGRSHPELLRIRGIYTTVSCQRRNSNVDCAARPSTLLRSGTNTTGKYTRRLTDYHNCSRERRRKTSRKRNSLPGILNKNTLAAFASGLKLAAAFGTVAAKTTSLALASIATGADKFSELVKQEALRSQKSNAQRTLPKQRKMKGGKRTIRREQKREVLTA